jgi:hypothetical protein
MLIQVDVDSTLYDSDKLFVQVGKELGIKWPKNSSGWIPPTDLLRDDGTTCTKQDVINMFRLAHSRENVMKQKPYSGAATVLGRIADMYDDVEIAYVSDRNAQAATALKDWLEEQGFLFSDDQHVAATKDKRHWMRERRPEIVIDDRVRTLLMARFELGSYGIGLEQTWNTNLKGEVDHIYIAKDWDAIDKILHDIVIPKVQEQTVSRSVGRQYAMS